MAKDETITLSLIDGVTKNLKEIQKGVGGVGAELAKMNQVAELAGKAFDGLSSVGNFFGDLVNDAGAYEQTLLQVQTRTQATTEESKLLREAIQLALQDTATGATAAADALRLLAEDGASATEAAQNLGEVVAFAQANTRGLAETVGSLGAVLDAFGEAPAKIGALADALTATAAAAGTSTAVIEKGLSGAGIAATQANLSLDETIGLIGALAERGIEGGRAAAALNKILGDMQNPASAAGQALRDAGVDTSDLSGIFETLANDAGLAEKVLSGLGNKPRAALKLLLTEGGAALAGINKAITESAGATKRASDALGEGYPLALKRLQESIENAKIAFATPLLAPLAGAFDAFATRINTFAQSEQFKQIADEIAQFVATGLEYVAKFVEGFDFEAAVGEVTQFAKTTGEMLTRVQTVLDETLTAGANFGDGFSAAFNAAVAGVSLSLASAIGAFATFSEEAESLSLSLASIGNTAREDTGAAIARIVERMDAAAAATALAAKQTEELRKQYVSAVPQLNAFGKSLEDQLAHVGGLAPAFDATRNSVMRVTAAEIELRKAQEDLNKTMAAATTATYEAELGRLVRAQTALINSGVTSGTEFKQLSDQIAVAEAAIAKLKEASAGAGKTLADTGNDARDAAGGLREYADAAGSAGRAADSASESNSAVSDSFGNIGRQSSSIAISLGNLTEAFVRQAQAAAGASTSADDYRETWNAFIAQSEQIEQRLANRIDLLTRMTAATDEESRIRAELEQQYGTSSRRLEELVQLELKLAEAKRQRNQEAEREIEIEDRRQQQAGGIGTQGRAAQTDTVAATGGRGTAAGGGSRIDAPIAITVNGLPSDRETWRQLVADVIVPEIKRIERLSR